MPTSIIDALGGSGHEVAILREHIRVDSPDTQIINAAQRFDSILLSLNGDFSDIVTYPPENYRGIISVQLNDHSEIIPNFLGRLLDFLSSYSEMDYYMGKLLLV